MAEEKKSESIEQRVMLSLRVSTRVYLLHLLRTAEAEFSALSDKRGLGANVRAQGEAHLEQIRSMIAEVTA